MTKYLITGNAGTGKSSVIEILRVRGFAAYDTDELPDLTRRVAPKNNTQLAYSNEWDEEALRSLLASDHVVFIGGSVSNQQDFYPMFSKMFGLCLDQDSLDHRLATRTNNPTGNGVHDRAFLLSINKRIEDNLKIVGAEMIDASQPLDTVVDNILKLCDVTPTVAQ